MLLLNFKVESEKSQERLQQDLAVLGQLTLPPELQFQLHHWKELPLGPWPITWDAYVDVIFNVQQKLFFCHKVAFAGEECLVAFNAYFRLIIYYYLDGLKFMQNVALNTC